MSNLEATSIMITISVNCLPQKMARYNRAVAAHPALVSMMIPMLRQRGFDGLLVSLKVAVAE